jgi:hypothetical protein
MDLLRHGGMGRLFDEVRAPSTLGTFLRLFTFGHIRQLDAVAARFLARLAAVTPVLSGAGQVAFVDVDDTVRATYGYAKQGAGRGYTGVNGLNALLLTLSTPLSAPVIAATRLRRGAVYWARGAARLLADALACARRAGATGLVIVRADSAFYGYDIVAVARRAGARFSPTARLTPAVTSAITSIDELAWTPIRYPNAIYDHDEQRWISDAEVAEVPFTAFTSRRHAEHITARGDRAPGAPAQPDHRHTRWARGAVRRLPVSRGVHRQPRADVGRRGHPPRPRDHRAGHRRPQGLRAGAPALRALQRQRCLAGLRSDRAQPHPRHRPLASTFHARARTGTIRTQLINTPARLARSAHRLVRHLPRNWPWKPHLTSCSLTLSTTSSLQWPDHPPSRARPETTVEKPSRPADHRRPAISTPI